jgi:3-dehydroquinate dehydratase/shikimate dehydrogenase
MLCFPIVSLSQLPIDEMVEFRFDLFQEFDLNKIQEARRHCKKPVLFTCRNKEQIIELAKLEPDYFDLDHTIEKPFLDQLKIDFPKVKWVISYHNHHEVPLHLDEILLKMQHLGGDLYKVACLSPGLKDAIRMYEFAKKHPPLFGIAMGEKGEFTRILGLHSGTPWTFATLSESEKTAPGQLTKEEYEIYGSGKTLFALIGGSLKKRKSHIYHNRVMRGLGGVYLKIPLEDPDELKPFLEFAKKNGFKGLSVTDPLKEHIIEHLDHIDPYAKEIGAVNTILFKEGKAHGYNTDGKGALDAIEKRMFVKGKKVTVLGAGGAAKSIIYEALQRGATVSLLNRTREKALKLADKWNLTLLDEIDPCDILINTTPVSFEWNHRCIAMEISSVPKETPFIEKALSLGCPVIYGMEMWTNQAVGQYQIWMPFLDRTEIFTALSNAQAT